jgi:hypothetical protein
MQAIDVDLQHMESALGGSGEDNIENYANNGIVIAPNRLRSRGFQKEARVKLTRFAL